MFVHNSKIRPEYDLEIMAQCMLPFFDLCTKEQSPMQKALECATICASLEKLDDRIEALQKYGMPEQQAIDFVEGFDLEYFGKVIHDEADIPA